MCVCTYKDEYIQTGISTDRHEDHHDWTKYSGHGMWDRLYADMFYSLRSFVGIIMSELDK